MNKESENKENPASFHWPNKVKPLTWADVGALGVHEETRELYWNGKPVVTKKKINLTFGQGFLGALGALGIFLTGLTPFLEFITSFWK